MIFYEATPNPQAMKFLLGQSFGDETLHIDDSLQADRSPLAKKLFGFPWMSSVMIGPDFVTITKQDWVSWEVLAEPLSELINEHIESGEPLMVQGASAVAGSENDSEIVKKIKMVLDSEIRPAVAMDGGDITFDRFEDGKLHLHMRGSCAGCPSASMTLKQGIETRMQELFPEVKEVVSSI